MGMGSEDEEEKKGLLATSTKNEGTIYENAVASYENITNISRDPQNSSCTITCRVCQNIIDVGDKQDQYVVKCSYCHEATPIQNAPSGKKYVRCRCNCLLVCKVISQKIACPRPQCKRVITLVSGTSILSPPLQPGMVQVSCGHCQQMFLFHTSLNALARCPHCRKVSSVGPSFARGRGTLFVLIGGTLCMTAFLSWLFTGNLDEHPGLSILCLIMLILGSAALIRSIFYYTTKVSEPEIGT